MLTKFNAADIVMYKKETRLYVVWSVDAKSSGLKNYLITHAVYQIIPKYIYDRLEHGLNENHRIISDVKEEDLEAVFK